MALFLQLGRVALRPKPKGGERCRKQAMIRPSRPGIYEHCRSESELYGSPEGGAAGGIPPRN